MPCSLEKLVETQKKSGFHFPYMNAIFGEDAEVLTRKGVFPYDDYNGVDKDKCTALPSIENFKSELTKETITQKDYLFAQLVWKKFGCKTFRDYMILYLKTDIMLLADIFESFRDMCLNKHTGYELDPCHYYTSPGMAWDAALKLSKVTLELLTDEDMVLFFEKGLRGGISMISNRYAKANNPCIKGYDSAEINKEIRYLDMNNLYGGAMQRPLPYKNFQWDEDVSKYTTEYILSMPDDGIKKSYTVQELVETEEPINNDEYEAILENNKRFKEQFMTVKSDDETPPLTEDSDDDDKEAKTPVQKIKRVIVKINADGKKVKIVSKFKDHIMYNYHGATLMVDLEYPKELHDKHNDYPLCA
jgi:hypothetical protein